MPFWKATRALLRPHPGFPFLCCSKTGQKQTQNDVFMSQKQLLAPVLILQQPGVSGKCWEQHRDFLKHVSDSMGLSWHSEKLNVLLFHSGGQEKAFYTTTTTLPRRTVTGAPEMGTLKPTPETAHPFPIGLPPTNSFQFLCESVGYQVHIWWLNENVQLLCPRGQAKWEQSQPSTSPRHWETFCHSRERIAIKIVLQQTQLFTWENAIAWHRVFSPRFLPGLLFGHVQPRISPDGPRQGQVCRKSHGT